MGDDHTARASLAAGDGGPGRTIFNNATLRKQMVSMWGFLIHDYSILYTYTHISLGLKLYILFTVFGVFIIV